MESEFSPMSRRVPASESMMVDREQASGQPAKLRARWVDYVALVAAMGSVVALRWHTIDEPLDCDEAAYGYVAHRLIEGDRLYVDVFENKPPLAYAPYAAAIWFGGLTERAIRILPIPFVLVTVCFVWRLALEQSGSVAAAAAAGLYAITSSDPFLFGNGANLEVYMNALLAWSLHSMSRAIGPNGFRWCLQAGIAAGCTAAIKQVAGLYVAIYAVWIWQILRRGNFGIAQRLHLLAGLVGGWLIPWFVCMAFVAQQGVTKEFFHSVFRYAPTLAKEAAAGVRRDFGDKEIARMVAAHPMLADAIRQFPSLLSAVWFVRGNPDATAWWGKGIWPLLAFAGAVSTYFLVRPLRRTRVFNLVLWFILVSAVAIFWPGLFWQHYYMLSLPGIVLMAALGIGGLASAVDLSSLRATESWPRATPTVAGLSASAAVAVCLLWIQYQNYVLLTPDAITTRHKGGAQWVALRDLGTKLRQLAQPDDRLFNWGWQSPLHVYSRMDSVTPYFFTDPLLQNYDVRDHPLVTPRKKRILADLQQWPPAVVFVGQRPFPELEQFLSREYIPTVPPATQEASGGRGLYVRRDVATRANTLQHSSADSP